MAITPMTDSLDIIAGLDDEPNDVIGLTAAQLKAKYDTAGNTIKNYLNNTMAPAIEADITAAVSAAQIGKGNVPIGGAAGQVIKKNSATDFDFGWGAVSGDSNPTAGTMMQRDANARAQVADPSAAQDIATKNYVDTSNPMVLISKTTTGTSANQVNINVGTITGYNKLILRGSNIQLSANDSINVRLNGDSTNGHYFNCSIGSANLASATYLTNFASSLMAGVDAEVELTLLVGPQIGGTSFGYYVIGVTCYDMSMRCLALPTSINKSNLSTINIYTQGSANILAGAVFELYGVK